jgi:hypothetical protein
MVNGQKFSYKCYRTLVPETGFFCGNFVTVKKIDKNPVSLVRVRKS